MLGSSSTRNMSTDRINRSWEEESLGLISVPLVVNWQINWSERDLLWEEIISANRLIVRRSLIGDQVNIGDQSFFGKSRIQGTLNRLKKDVQRSHSQRWRSRRRRRNNSRRRDCCRSRYQRTKCQRRHVDRSVRTRKRVSKSIITVVSHGKRNRKIWNQR